MNRAVFLDRDNTIIHNDGDLGDPEGVRLIQGAASAMASLRGLGYKIVVVSNQGGVARGKYTEQDVDAVNERIAQIVQRVSGASIDRFYYCPFHPEGSVRQYKREHPWRKPAPGMLRQAADDLNLDLAQCWTVGDQPRDIEAGRAAGTRTILLRDRSGAHGGAGIGSGEHGLLPGVDPDFVAASLVEAVRVIAQQRRPEREAAPLAKPTSPAVAKQTHAGAAAAATAPTHAAHPSARVEPLGSATTTAAAPAASSESRAPAAPRPVVVELPPAPAPAPAPVPTSAPAPIRAPEPEPPGATDYLPDGDDVEDEVMVDIDAAASPAEAPPAVPAAPAAPIAAAQASRAASLASPIRPARPPAQSPARPLESSPERAPAAGPTPMTPGVPSPRLRQVEAPIEPTVEPAAAPSAPPVDRPLVPREDAAQIEELLRQILRQLKRHQADQDDFSYLKMSAAVFQMVAVACVMFGLYYGVSGEPNGVLAFLQWFLGAILVQIAVVTLLILHWQK